MSAADAPLGPAAVRRAPLRLGGRFLRSELVLVFGRRRNLAGMLVLAGVPVLIAVAVRLSGSGSRRGGPDFFSSITDNGFFVALAALSVELPLFLPIAVAAISADSIAGEANLGTLRYLLPVPVHRTRLLAVKYLTIVAFTFVATVWVATVGLVAGLALFGGGPVTLLSGSQIDLGDGLLRLLAICVYLAACLSALGALGLFVSTLTEQPIGATIAIVCASVASFIVDSIPQVSWVHPYLLTHWWLSFGDLLRDPMATDGIRHGLLTAGAYALIFTTAAWARFTNRDVTS